MLQPSSPSPRSSLSSILRWSGYGLLGLLVGVVLLHWDSASSLSSPLSSPLSSAPRDLPAVAVSERIAPRLFDGDLRELSRLEPWRDGDPVHGKGEDHERQRRPRLEALVDVLTPTAPDPLVRRQQRSAAVAADALAGPDPSFYGIAFTGANPPDTIGEAGPRHYIQMVNGHGAGPDDSAPMGASFAIWNKTGERQAGPLALSSLWPDGVCRDFARGDPVVVHDGLADRWVLMELAVPPECFGGENCHLCLAVSRTPDPLTGGWFLYRFHIPGALPDYPKLGVWPDFYGVGTNHASPGDQRAGAYALERDRMLRGEAARIQIFTAPFLPNSGFLQSLLPADLEGPKGPPAGSPLPFLRYRDGEVQGDLDPGRDHLELWELAVDWEDPDRSALFGPVLVEVAEFDSGLAPVPQPAGPALPTFHDPLMWRVGYHNFRDREVLVGNFSVGAGTGDEFRAAVRWFELRRSDAGGWSTFQEGTFAPDEAHRWMGSVAMDATGNLLLGYGVVSAELGLYPSLRVAGRRAGDPTGVLTTDEVSLLETSGTPASGWGDYSAMSLDPAEGCTFWYTHQYPGDDGTWRTRVGAFRFKDCEAGTPPPEPEPCVEDDETLCLAQGRFRVRVHWETAQGTSGAGRADPLTDDTGTFWFFDPANVELVVKVLDACPVNQRFWVFAAGLTDVETRITVEDTARGASQVYRNPRRTAFLPVQDTTTFDTCP